MSQYEMSPDSDMNAFLVNFLETDEDQFNQISIRLSVVEFIQEVGLSDGTYPDILQEVARDMYSNKNEALSTQTLSQMLLEFTSAKEVDIFRHTGSIPECQV